MSAQIDLAAIGRRVVELLEQQGVPDAAIEYARADAAHRARCELAHSTEPAAVAALVEQIAEARGGDAAYKHLAGTYRAAATRQGAEAVRHARWLVKHGGTLALEGRIVLAELQAAHEQRTGRRLTP